jgi:hypothetical protein
MPRLSVARIVKLGIGELERLDRERKRDFFGFDQQIHVIGIKIKSEHWRRPRRRYRSRRRDSMIIRPIMKGGRAAVATSNDVREGTGEFHVRFSNHSRNRQETAHLNQYSCLTLISSSTHFKGELIPPMFL